MMRKFLEICVYILLIAVIVLMFITAYKLVLNINNMGIDFDITVALSIIIMGLVVAQIVKSIQENKQ